MAFPQGNGQADIGTADNARADIVDKLMAAAVSAMTLTRRAAILGAGRRVAAVAASHTVTGRPANPVTARRLLAMSWVTAAADQALADLAQADHGPDLPTVTAAGGTTRLAASRVCPAGLAGVVATPTDAIFVWDRVVRAERPAYTTTGPAARITADRRLAASRFTSAEADIALADYALADAGPDQSSLRIGGDAAADRYTRVLSADPAPFDLAVGPALSGVRADPAQFTITGGATLRLAYELIACPTESAAVSLVACPIQPVDYGLHACPPASVTYAMAPDPAPTAGYVLIAEVHPTDYTLL